MSACSFDAWYAVPSSSNPITFLRPVIRNTLFVSKQSIDLRDTTYTHVSPFPFNINRILPPLALTHNFFSITAWNPMGQPATITENRKNNLLLATELAKLCEISVCFCTGIIILNGIRFAMKNATIYALLTYIYSGIL